MYQQGQQSRPKIPKQSKQTLSSVLAHHHQLPDASSFLFLTLQLVCFPTLTFGIRSHSFYCQVGLFHRVCSLSSGSMLCLDTLVMVLREEVNFVLFKKAVDYHPWDRVLFLLLYGPKEGWWPSPNYGPLNKFVPSQKFPMPSIQSILPLL